MPMKFKEGEKYKVIDRHCGHRYDIGSVVTVTHPGNKSFKALEKTASLAGNLCTWWLTEDEVIPMVRVPGVDCLFTDEI